MRSRGTAALQPRKFRDQLILGVLVLERRAPRCSHVPQRRGHLMCRADQHEQRWQRVVERADGSGQAVQSVGRSGVRGAQEQDHAAHHIEVGGNGDRGQTPERLADDRGHSEDQQPELAPEEQAHIGVTSDRVHVGHQ